MLLFACAHTPPLVVQDQAEFIAQVAKKNPPIGFLKAKAKIAISTPQKTYPFKVGLLMNAKGSMFIEAYGFGVPQSYASLVDNQLRVVVPSQRILYIGSGDSSLEKILNIKVSANALFDPLLRRIFSAQRGPFQITADKKQYIMTDSYRNEFKVDPSYWIQNVISNHTPWKSVQYGPPLNAETPYPKNLKLNLEHGSMQISFEDVTVDQSIENKLFQIDVPSQGFDIYSID